MTTVIRSLEHALDLARRGELVGMSLAYMNSEHGIYQCLEAKDAISAVTLLGQGAMMIEDLRGLTRDLRNSERDA
jgi:hypothetical protein